MKKAVISGVGDGNIAEEAAGPAGSADGGGGGAGIATLGSGGRQRLLLIQQHQQLAGGKMGSAGDAVVSHGVAIPPRTSTGGRVMPGASRRRDPDPGAGSSALSRPAKRSKRAMQGLGC